MEDEDYRVPDGSGLYDVPLAIYHDGLIVGSLAFDRRTKLAGVFRDLTDIDCSWGQWWGWVGSININTLPEQLQRKVR